MPTLTCTAAASRFVSHLALLAIVAGLGVGLGLNPGSVAHVHAQTATTAAVFQAQNDAVNRGDAAAGAALYSPQAILIGGPDCFPTACFGSAAISRHFLNQINQHLQGTILSEYVEGSAVTGRAEVHRDGLAAAGVERLIAIYTMIVQDDHIVLWITMPDRTDPQTAQFLASQGASQGPG